APPARHRSLAPRRARLPRGPPLQPTRDRAVRLARLQRVRPPPELLPGEEGPRGRARDGDGIAAAVGDCRFVGWTRAARPAWRYDEARAPADLRSSSVRVAGFSAQRERSSAMAPIPLRRLDARSAAGLALLRSEGAGRP